MEPVPALRIIEPTLWDAAQQRLEAARRVVTDERHDVPADDEGAGTGSTRGARLVAARRPNWLLSGLVRCGSCGGSMTVVGEHGRLGCANHRERDTCDNRRTVLRDRILARVLTGLKHRLLAPELVATFVAEYIAEVNFANRNAASRRSQLQTDLVRVDRQIKTIGYCPGIWCGQTTRRSAIKRSG
jgi:site-specific DNA recombinase